MQRQCGFFACLVLCCHADAAIADAPVPTGWFSASIDHKATEYANPGAGYFSDKERGWFWYEHDPEPEEAHLPMPIQHAPPPKQPVAKTEPQPPAPAGPVPLSAEWLRKNMEKYRDQAIDSPTRDNVAAYLYLQRVMMDKAERFSQAFQGVVMADPLLDENTRRPIAIFGGNEQDAIAKKLQTATLTKLGKMAGLWFFYESTCQFCVRQAEVLKGLQTTYGFSILPIAMDGLPLQGSPFKDYIADNGQARQLGVNMTPALFLVKPGAGGSAIQIGQGLFAMNDIVERSLYLAHAKHWIDTGEYEGTRPVKPLLVDSAIGSKLGAETLQDNAKLVDLIRENLKSRYRH
jgi:conjugal transfer pilus assembly protein TraF